jgi:hypothetical protein
VIDVSIGRERQQGQYLKDINTSCLFHLIINKKGCNPRQSNEP